jgi:hypothetical protein
MNVRMMVLVGALAFAAPAAAQTRAGDYSVLGATTVPAGSDVLSGRFGWPDLTLEYTHGVRPGFDVGGRMQFLFGVENTTDSKFGIAFAVPLRFRISESGRARLAFHVDPGLRLYTYSPALFGFQAPFGINVELPASAPLKFGFGADFNATLFVTGDGSPYFFFGPLIGPWMEYHVDQRLSFGVDTRFGAIIDAYSGYGGGTESKFGLRAQMMLGYRI